jgi:hypothetical protein
MVHHVLSVSVVDKPAVVRQLAAGQQRSLLFTRTKHGAKKLAKQLTQAGIPAVELHGNLSQNARERNLASFSDGSTRVLVATDIAARGIHVDEIGLVVRAGAEGVVVTVATPDQAGDVRGLARAAGISPTVTAVGPGHARIVELAGDLAPHVQPSAAVIADRVDRPRHPRPQGRSSSARPAGQSRGGQSSSGGAGGQSRGGGAGQARPAGQGRPGTRSRSRYSA